MNTFASSRFRRSHTTSIVAAFAFALCAGFAHAQSTTTWTGSAASGDWSTAGNWNNGAPTTSGTWALTFANTTQTSSTNTIGGASDTVTLSSLTITSNTAVALARAETRTLTLINNSSIYIGGTNSINHTSSIPLTLLGSSTVSGLSNRNLQWNAVISGTGSLSLTAGTLYLGFGVVNTFSGGLTISSGASLDVAGNSALGTGPLTINGGLLNARGALRTVTNSGVVNGDFTFGGTNPLVLSGSFNLNGGTRVITLNGSPNAGTMSGVISNGGITKAGLAPLVLSGTNTYSGATTINSGTLQIGSGATTGSLNPASTITGSAGATLAFNRTNTITQGTDFNSVIGGSIGVAQVGSGTLVLGGVNTYSGRTSIQNGTLSVATINNASASGNLGTNATIDLGGSATTGALLYTGAGETTDRVVNLAGTTGGGTLDHSGSGSLRFSADITTTGAGPKSLTLRGSGAGTGELSGRLTDGVTGTTTLSSQFVTSATTITLDSVTGISVGAAISGANIPASTTVTAINTATRVVTLSQATTTGTTAAGTLITVAGVANPNSLTKAGTGTWTLSAANTYTGVTTVTGGVLAVSNLANGGSTSGIGASSNAAGNLVLGGGSLKYTGATATTDRAFTLTASTTSTIDVATADTTLTFTGSTASTAGALAKAGAGTLVFSGPAGYTGATAINAGTLQIGSGGTAGSLATSSAITGSAGGTLAFSRSDEITQGTHFNSVIGGSINVAQVGSGTLTLSGANTYTGTTSVAAGLLKTSNADRIADGSPIQVTGGILRFGGNDTVAAIGGSGGTIDVDVYSLTSSMATSSTFAGLLIGNRTNVSGSGGSGFYKTGSGTLTLSGSVSLSADNNIFNQVTNRLQVSGGELVLAGTTTLANMQTRLANGTTLRIASGSHAFNAGSRTGSGEGLTIQNGQVVVDGGVSTAATVSVGYGTGSANVFTMNTGTFTASLMTLGNQIGAADGATVNLNGGVLAAGSFTNQGGQTAISFNGGTLQMLGTSVVPSNTNTNGNVLALNVGNGGAILDTGTFANTISQGLVGVGSGGLTKLGSAQLTLAGTNTYSGATMISAGTLAFSSTSGLQGTSGVSIAGGAGLTYTGGATSFGKNITVTSGTGTVRNSGGGTLTLGGTLTKDGTVLRLTGGSFNVTGLITGTTVGASDLIVDAASVTLSNTNSYNGPTYVYNSGTLALGIDNAIPNTSGVTLGNDTSRGTLVTGSFTDSISQLVFSGSGGTVSLSGDKTASAQLATAGSLTLGSNASLVLTSAGTSAGLYRLISATSISGSFASSNITGTSAAYQILTTSTSVDYQQRAVLGAVSVTNPAAAIITGGSAAFTYSVTNTALSGGAALPVTGTGLSNVGGTSSGTAAGGGSSGSLSGLVFTGTGVGAGQQGTFTVNAPTAYGATSTTGTVSVDVYGHASGSAAGTTIALADSIVGYTGSLSGLTSATISNAAGYRVNLMTTGGTSAGFVSINNVSGIASGSSSMISAAASLNGTQTVGPNSVGQVFNLTYADNSALAGASNNLGSQSITVTGKVLDHATSSLAASLLTSTTISLGTWNYATNQWEGGSSGTGLFDIFNIASSYGAPLTADLALLGVSGTANGFSTNVASFTDIAGGGSRQYSIFADTTGWTTSGLRTTTFTLSMGDKVGMAGATTSNTLSVTAQVIVVPEPGALVLAGIGIGLAGWLLCRRQT